MLKWLQSLLILIVFFALTVTNLVAITSTTIGATLSSILASAIGRKPVLVPAPNLSRVALQSQLDFERERNRRMKLQLDTQISKNRALVSRMDRPRASIRSMGRSLVSRSKRIAVVTLAPRTHSTHDTHVATSATSRHLFDDVADHALGSDHQASD